MTNYKLPKDFLWGTAHASHQIEGAWDIDGKGKSISDCMKRGENGVIVDNGTLREINEFPENDIDYPSHFASDFYHTYKEDVKKLKGMGITALRFSIGWTRIFPNGDEDTPNQKGIDFYTEFIDYLKSLDIEPVITINHFEMPMNLITKYGGWTNKKMIDFYMNFVRVVFENYGDKVKFWMTHNEIDNQMNYLHRLLMIQNAGAFKFTDDEAESIMYRASHNLLVSSAMTVKEGHEICDRKGNKDVKIGCMLAFNPFYAENSSPEENLQQMRIMNLQMWWGDVHCNGYYPKWLLKYLDHKNIELEVLPGELDLLKDYTVDYIAFSYYKSYIAKTKDLEWMEYDPAAPEIPNKFLGATDWGWQIDPIGLRWGMNWMMDRWGKPLFCVECGFGAYDDLVEENGEKKIHDQGRIDYLKDHIKYLKQAIAIDGIECYGFLTWGSVDMVSASSGEIKKRYGLVYIDIDDQGQGSGERYYKDSYYWYKKVIESNGDILE